MLLTVTDLLTCCQGMFVTRFEVLKPCYTVENSTKLDTKCEHSFLHQKMSGTEKKLSNNSTKHSITREQLQGGPLTSRTSLKPMLMFSMGLESFQGYLTNSNSNQMQNPLDMHLGKCLYTCMMLSMRKSGIWKH